MLENRQQVVDDFALQNCPQLADNFKHQPFPQLAEDFNKAYFDTINEYNITYFQDIEIRLQPVGDSTISVNHLQRADEFGILFSIPWSHHEYIINISLRSCSSIHK